MPASRDGKTQHGADADIRRRLVVFALVEALFMLFITLPVLLWLFVFANGLSEAELTRYCLGIVALQVAVSALLLWKFRIIPSPPTDKQDAR